MKGFGASALGLGFDLRFGAQRQRSGLGVLPRGSGFWVLWLCGFRVPRFQVQVFKPEC